MVTENVQPKYLTVSEWCKTHSWPPMGGLRHLIFHSETNGFNRVLRRCGRRILINEQEFFKWIEANNYDKAQISMNKDNKETA